MVRDYAQFIAGDWQQGSGETYTRTDPYSGAPVYRLALARADDAQRAIGAARAAADHGAWSGLDPHLRADVLRRFADALEADKDRLGAIESQSNGAPLRYARNFVSSAAKVFRYYAGLACMTDGDAALFNPCRAGLIVREPAGVASLIAPWNFPLGELSWKLAPALAAGCCVVLKPDTLTAATALEAARLLHDCGLPAGVVNVVVGEVADLGPGLVGDPRIDVVSFTGSTASGRAVMTTAAQTVKPAHLELGGKSALIVTRHCDVEAAAKDAAGGIFWHNGQICTACSRILVDASVYAAFRAAFVAAAMDYAPGDPIDDSYGNGPLVSDAHSERVAAAIARAVDEGGTLTLDGRTFRGPARRRNLIGPTIVEGLGNAANTAQAEIFGPVAVLIPYEGLASAIDIANDTPFGLGAGIWSDQFGEVMTAIRALKAGSIWINGYGAERLEMPWGGVKQSGHGKELGLEGLRAFQIQKSVHITG